MNSPTVSTASLSPTEYFATLRLPLPARITRFAPRDLRPKKDGYRRYPSTPVSIIAGSNREVRSGPRSFVSRSAGDRFVLLDRWPAGAKTGVAGSAEPIDSGLMWIGVALQARTVGFTARNTCRNRKRSSRSTWTGSIGTARAQYRRSGRMRCWSLCGTDARAAYPRGNRDFRLLILGVCIRDPPCAGYPRAGLAPGALVRRWYGQLQPGRLLRPNCRHNRP